MKWTCTWNEMKMKQRRSKEKMNEWTKWVKWIETEIENDIRYIKWKWKEKKRNEMKKQWINDGMNEWMNERMNAWMNEWMNERTNELINERMSEWVSEWLREWMYVLNWTGLNWIELSWMREGRKEQKKDKESIQIRIDKWTIKPIYSWAKKDWLVQKAIPETISTLTQ